MTDLFAFIIIVQLTILNILINTFNDHLFCYQIALQIPPPNTEYKQRFYSVHSAPPQCAHGAVEDPTALPQRPHSALSNMMYKRQAAAFLLCMFMIYTDAWRSRQICLNNSDFFFMDKMST